MTHGEDAHGIAQAKDASVLPHRVTPSRRGFITTRQAAVLAAYIDLTVELGGYAPTVREMCARLNVTENAVTEALARLVREGCLRRCSGTHKIMRFVVTGLALPVFDRAPATPPTTQKLSRKHRKAKPKPVKAPKIAKQKPAKAPKRITWCAWCGEDTSAKCWARAIIRSPEVRFCGPLCLAEYDAEVAA